MKNSAINTLSYTGIVTLSRYKNGKKIPIKQFKNSGGYPLFSFLTNCLLGDFDTARLELPTKIMLLRATKFGALGTELSLEPASDFIQYVSLPERLYSVTAGSTVCYSFVIPMSLIENTEFNSIGLYPHMASADDIDNYAAFCEIDSLSALQSTSALLLVDWRLTITNGSSNNS